MEQPAPVQRPDRLGDPHREGEPLVEGHRRDGQRGQRLSARIGHHEGGRHEGGSREGRCRAMTNQIKRLDRPGGVELAGEAVFPMQARQNSRSPPARLGHPDQHGEGLARTCHPHQKGLAVARQKLGAGAGLDRMVHGHAHAVAFCAAVAAMSLGASN